MCNPSAMCWANQTAPACSLESGTSPLRHLPLRRGMVHLCVWLGTCVYHHALLLVLSVRRAWKGAWHVNIVVCMLTAETLGIRLCISGRNQVHRSSPAHTSTWAPSGMQSTMACVQSLTVPTCPMARTPHRTVIARIGTALPWCCRRRPLTLPRRTLVTCCRNPVSVRG